MIFLIKHIQQNKKQELFLNIFSVLIIFVACLGLFGLATYTAEQRTKEIGIRKVLGCKCIAGNTNAFKRIFKIGVDSITHCISCCMVGNE